MNSKIADENEKGEKGGEGAPRITLRRDDQGARRKENLAKLK